MMMWGTEAWGSTRKVGANEGNEGNCGICKPAVVAGSGQGEGGGRNGDQGEDAATGSCGI